MTYETPFYAFEESEAARLPIDELDHVTLAYPVESAAGERVPEGASGTVVGVYAGGKAFEVEFTQPFNALATVHLDGVIKSGQSDF
ncbi:DUF4926 domain-containing protein [Methylobacterium sp. E-016]|uniref:DUF4926 domain-containing protein n=1 Tax=Methylobacterium sp. E-016 TaxID=2836556 RepID=UPI001FB98B5A|nr:DUF4926 domain-containing protein [Methylobacterium sp. E-016]MCJ2074116.1 DUF4926 domain-containing protein [Methylobacterium sp. E-016]